MYYVYIVATPSRRVLYTGVTGDLKKRIQEHRGELIEGWRREKKIRFIEEQNPTWADLFE